MLFIHILHNTVKSMDQKYKLYYASHKRLLANFIKKNRLTGS